MIMLVMHDAAQREQVVTFLEERGYTLCVPLHRHDVPVMVQDVNPSLILLDLSITKPGGIDVLTTLRTQGYTGKVIGIAGVAMRSIIPQAFQLGIDQVVGGPQGNLDTLNLPQLDATIHACFH